MADVAVFWLTATVVPSLAVPAWIRISPCPPSAFTIEIVRSALASSLFQLFPVLVNPTVF